MSRNEHELPKFAQMLRDRGLPVNRVTTVDIEYADGNKDLPGSIMIVWTSTPELHHKSIAHKLAYPIASVLHSTVAARKAHEAAEVSNGSPTIINADGSTQTYVVGHGWIDADE